MVKYFVYVIELDSKVAEHKKFRLNNPRYIKGNGCLYVGQSSRPPKVRFEQHKEGYKSNKYAKIYGLRLRPDNCTRISLKIKDTNLQLSENEYIITLTPYLVAA